MFIFADSRYQNYLSTNTVSLRKCIGDLCEPKNNPFHVLHDIHRNTRKIVSFLVACIGDHDEESKNTFSCSSKVDGDDIEIRTMNNILERSSENELIELAKSILTKEEKTDNDHLYEPKDVAILLDTDNSVKDAEKLMCLFQRFAPDIQVHSAGVFPVTGLTVDTLDNFVGFDRQVCICVSSHSIWNVFRKRARDIRNPKYRTFIASRGISKVIFVTSTSIDIRLAKMLKMDDLPVVSVT